MLTFSGSGLDSVNNLWTSFGAETERVANTNTGQVSFAVRCPDAAIGIEAVQLVGSEGASNFRLLMIDRLKVIEHKGEHRSAEKALKITPPAAVDGTLKSEQIDYYQFASKAGQTYSIEVIAHRIGSQMDPMVRLLDSEGRELMSCDDEGGVWKDARFRFTAPVDGDFIIAVHDIGYGGGSNFDYRLRVSNDPLVWSTFPLVDPEEGAAAFESMGNGSVNQVTGSPANPPQARMSLAWPQLAEAEPNNDSNHAQEFVSPILLHGKMESGAAIDCFRFKASKNQKLIFRSQSRSLGSPCDLVLRIKKQDGSVAAESNSALALDAALTNRFQDAGSYVLEVRELSGVGVTNAPYRVIVEEFVPGFTVGTENNSIEMKPGGTAKMKVTAERYESEGPIELKLQPEIPGIALENYIIPEKKNEVELVFKAKEELAAGTFKHVALTAHGTNGLPVKVSTKPALRKAFPLMLNTPPELEGVVTVIARGK